MTKRRLLLTLAASLLLVTPSWAGGTTKGVLAVAGKKLTLSNVYAYGETGFFDKTKTDVVVILSEVPIPALDGHTRDAVARNSAALEATVQQFQSITLNSEGQIISVRPQQKAFKIVPSGASTDFVFEKKVHGGKPVSGRASSKVPKKGFDGEVWEFDVASASFRERIRDVSI
jgi:hypothetical protein